VPGPPPESALAKLQALLSPTPSRYPDPIENWSIERLIPPEIARQDLQPGGYAEGSPVPKLEPLIREAWSPTAQELLDWLVSLNSKGAPETQRDVDYLADRILEGLKAREITGGEHSHGGTSRKERYYPAEGNRKDGSGRSDLTIRIGDKTLGANTGVFLMDHETPIADERRKGAKMSHLQTLQKDFHYPFLVLPKRKGFTEEEWKETTDRMIDEFLTTILWPVKK
jgi:hypothetical protein